MLPPFRVLGFPGMHFSRCVKMHLAQTVFRMNLVALHPTLEEVLSVTAIKKGIATHEPNISRASSVHVYVISNSNVFMVDYEP